jgi:hypothetical protein
MPNNAQKVMPDNSQSDNPPNGQSLGIALEPEGKRLSRAEFQGLGDMPPELEWFANLDNPRTRRAYRNDVKEFTAFAGVERPEEMRQVTSENDSDEIPVKVFLHRVSRYTDSS